MLEHTRSSHECSLEFRSVESHGLEKEFPISMNSISDISHSSQSQYPVEQDVTVLGDALVFVDEYTSLSSRLATLTSERTNGACKSGLSFEPVGTIIFTSKSFSKLFLKNSMPEKLRSSLS